MRKTQAEKRVTIEERLNALEMTARIGKVTSVNKSARTAQVYYEEGDANTSEDMKVLSRKMKGTFPCTGADGGTVTVELDWMPKVGDYAITLHRPGDQKENTGWIVGVL